MGDVVETTKDKKTLGELNGWQLFVFKVIMTIFPIVFAAAVPWATWITAETMKNQAFRIAGDRYTKADAKDMEMRIFDRISQLPPDDWRQRIEKIEDAVRRMNDLQIRMSVTLDRLEKQQH